MNIKNLFFEKYKAYGWASSVFFFIPLIPYIENTIFQDISIGFGVSLFTSWVILNTFNKEFIDFLCNQIIPFQDQIKYSGLSNIVFKNNLSDLNIDIVNSDNLVIVMNDGKNFSSNNSTALYKRYANKKLTQFVILNPESDYEPFLCKQHGKEIGFYKTKINDLINDLKIRKNDGANIEIYLSDFSVRTSIILTDTKAIVGTYRNTKGKDNTPPSYIYEKDGCEFNNIINDIEKLKNSSKKEL
ncbi:hypothetical protein HZI61_01375 [Haemophilus influenzae]|uniref:hypothetical protein n=1 Tax=Haemophilus influenzae TaxID=727 RepID=UPI0015C58691|nr:hypothetical protein [Haemophilus influenzae]NXZ83841.1 hypothetical protein [Haemophilus influenzae]